MRRNQAEPKKIITEVIQTTHENNVNTRETPNITNTAVREQTNYVTGVNNGSDVTVGTVRWEHQRATEDVILQLRANLQQAETAPNETWQERDIALGAQYDETRAHTQELIEEREIFLTQRTNDDVARGTEITTELNNVRTNLNNVERPTGLFDWVGNNYVTYGALGLGGIVLIGGIYWIINRENAANVVTPVAGLGFAGVAGAAALRTQEINVTVNAQQRTPADAVADVVKQVLPNKKKDH